jgi:large subunit ribosomal protein L3
MLEIIGQKVGMTHMFKSNGNIMPVTVLRLYDNCVIEMKSEENKAHNTLSIAFDKLENAKKLSKPVIGFFNKRNLPIHRIIHNSKIKKDSSFNSGDSIAFDKIFKEGSLISVRGTTIGKGFAGVMKRWNFRGLEASHGVSISHRSHGSTGQRQDPGKTFRGKKMAGHLGVDNITTKNLEIVFFDQEKKVVMIKGCVPGKSGSDIIIKLNNY